MTSSRQSSRLEKLTALQADSIFKKIDFSSWKRKFFSRNIPSYMKDDDIDEIFKMYSDRSFSLTYSANLNLNGIDLSLISSFTFTESETSESEGVIWDYTSSKLDFLFRISANNLELYSCDNEIARKYFNSLERKYGILRKENERRAEISKKKKEAKLLAQELTSKRDIISKITSQC